MQRAEFLKQIHENRLLPGYLFLGEEHLYHQELLDAAAEKLLAPEERSYNLVKLDAASTTPEQLNNALESGALFGDVRLVYLYSLEAANPILEEALLKVITNLATGVHLMASANKLDGRKKFSTEIQKRLVVVVCNKLTPQEVPVWIKQRCQKIGLGLTESQIRLVAQRFGNDLLSIRTELEKFRLYSLKTGKISDLELEALMPPEPEPDIFGLIDAVAARHPRQGLPKLRELLDSGENELKILATISRQIRNITAAVIAKQSGINSKVMAGHFGINPYVAEKSFAQTRLFSIPELQSILERLSEADFRIKTGQREARLELELAVIEIIAKLN